MLICGFLLQLCLRWLGLLVTMESFWMIFAFASFILGVESKKKEKVSNKNQ